MRLKSKSSYRCTLERRWPEKATRSAAADEFSLVTFFFKKKKVTIKIGTMLKVVIDYKEHRPTKSGDFVEQNQKIFRTPLVRHTPIQQRKTVNNAKVFFISSNLDKPYFFYGTTG